MSVMRTLSDRPAFEHLGAAECWQLVRSRSFGRICFWVDDRVQVVLAAYTVKGERVYFRAAAFGEVARRVRSRAVTLQVDDMTADHQAGWAVTVTGAARLVSDPGTVASLWSPVRPVTWEFGAEPLWISLTPDDVQGQRMRP